MKPGQQFTVGYGVATVLASIDFETYSEAGYRWDATLQAWKAPLGINKTQRGLEVVGLRAYVEHPSFDVLSLAYKIDEHPRVWVADSSPDPLDLFDSVRSGSLIEAWNAQFEFEVWSWCVRKRGWPVLPFSQLRCAMAKARIFSLPGKLGKTGEVLRLSVQKDKDGDRLLKKFSVPRNPTKKDPRTRILPIEDPHDAVKLYEYNITDVLSEEEAGARVPDLSEFELAVWQADQRINQRGVATAVDDRDACIRIIEQADLKYSAELREITNHQVQTAGQVEVISGFLRADGVYLDDLTEETISEALKRSDLPPRARRILEIRGALSSSSVKKLYSMREQTARDGRLRYLYQYAAARTHRWNGAGPQPMNLVKSGPEVVLCENGHYYGRAFFTCRWCDSGARKEVEWSPEAAQQALTVIRTGSLEAVEYIFGDALATVAGCLRSLFIAAPGHDYVCSDFTSIEGVVAAALSDEEWRLEVYRTHGLMYETSAARISGIPFEEFVQHRADTGGEVFRDAKGNITHIKGGKHHPLRNKQGKFAELALGFGGAVGAMRGFGADEFLTEQEMVAVVKGFRKASPNMVHMWGGQGRWHYGEWIQEYYGLEGAAVQALLSPGNAYEYKGHVFQMSADVLYMRSRAGTFLTYHAPRIVAGERGYDISYEGWNTNPKQGPRGWIRMGIYGGKFFENAVQHTARVIHANGILNLERHGYPVVLHTHDEPCTEVPEGVGSVEQVEHLMCMITPYTEFARGWPIKAKGGWRGKFYRKD